MPKSVYLMTLGIFVMVCSELLVGGLMPQMSSDLGASIPQIGYLITAFALAMALGGPPLTIAVLRLPTKNALLVLFIVFFIGNALAALSTSYSTMLVGRLVTGAASGAFFGVALSAVAQITTPELRGRATSLALQGLMLGTALGLPLSTLVGGQFGWRMAFVAIAVLTVVIAATTLLALPRLTPESSSGLRAELGVFRDPRLWFVMATSTLIIGATFAAFSYFAPILTDITGFSRSIVPLLLLAYGAATVVGNIIVGRLAQSHTISVIVAGLLLNAAFLVGFAVFAENPAAAIVAMVGIGLVGITLNPATITRVQRAGNAGSLVNTAHSSFITLGVVIGSWIGGLGINVSGLRAPLWVGAGLAVLALLAMVPAIVSAARAPREIAGTIDRPIPLKTEL
ncbi:MFS transporter [Streptomyces sp. ISL-112]|uniref:MFS transporter n=1 Tax=unclassified Streptomyces TaxID=2593676 RepID=UPI001BEB3929|nr:MULTISPECIES: MFS transporter [unclassified Streptomyces]MBT2430406.1 MFS transporter [Streptomyces sp. ISL-112]MBT2465783.1 MFS transporter [Streptomyces sp. ISL-63]